MTPLKLKFGVWSMTVILSDYIYFTFYIDLSGWSQVGVTLHTLLCVLSIYLCNHLPEELIAGCFTFIFLLYVM